jgi:hypothetical protein
MKLKVCDHWRTVNLVSGLREDCMGIKLNVLLGCNQAVSRGICGQIKTVNMVYRITIARKTAHRLVETIE